MRSAPEGINDSHALWAVGRPLLAAVGDGVALVNTAGYDAVGGD